MIKIIEFRDREKIEKIKERPLANIDKVEEKVKEVIKEVKNKGDKALLFYSEKFDNVRLENLEVTKKDIEEAYKKTGKKTIKSLKRAKGIIEDYCKKQLPKEWSCEIRKGIKIGQIIRPLDKVGCYVPCGNYPLPSTVLMTVIPAKIAGVNEIILCTPPKKNNEAIIAAADICGVDKIFKVGGSQAIAAMAYGTKTIPKVNKIVGPGNIYVTAAKKLVYGDTGIDFIAGPSEIIIFSEKGNEKFIAADMLAQAEHDKMASAIFVTTNKELAEKVKKEIEKQIEYLLTKDIAKESIKNNSAIIITKDIDEAFGFINELAPEHLEIMDDKELLKKVRNAGAVFLGSYSVEAAGDYAVGNHVLPTMGFAKVRAGLSVLDFIKMPTVQELSKEGLNEIKDIVINLAETEGLEAHKKSVEARLR